MTTKCTIHCLLLLLLLFGREAQAEPKFDYFFPAGGQVGQQVDLQVGGTFSTWPVTAWCNQPGLEINALPTGEDKTHRLSIKISPDAQPNIYWLRLFDETGSSVPAPFVVGHLEECNEIEPNNRPQQATPITSNTDAPTHSIVFNGQLKEAGDVDIFTIPAKQGQTLLADMDAHHPLGSSVDAVMQILSPQGFVVAQNDDQLSLDPRLAFDVPYDGLWYVRIFGFPATPTSRIQFAGEAGYVYRLTLSTAAIVDYAIPLAVQTEGQTKVKLFGWNLGPSQRQLTVAPDPTGYDVRLQSAGIAGTIRVPFVPHPVIIEHEPKSDSMVVDPPSTITGRIDTAGDEDSYSIDLKEGEAFIAKMESRSLGYPLDPVLVLLASDGKELSRVDDTAGKRDATLEYQCKQTERVRLVVQDLHKRGGEDFVYRLTLQSGKSDFELSVGQHQVSLAADGSVEIPVTVSRQGGFNESIKILAKGLPDGITAAPTYSQPDNDSAKSVKLKLQSTAEVNQTSLPIRISGLAERVPTKFAKISEPATGKPSYDLWLTITPPASTE
ncbi:MAG: PPC domain-containing protein [Pirellulaceae bacterium]|nr:PPC domain-containing protein [Pirellulaceae bacterium]